MRRLALSLFLCAACPGPHYVSLDDAGVDEATAGEDASIDVPGQGEPDAAPDVQDGTGGALGEGGSGDGGSGEGGSGTGGGGVGGAPGVGGSTATTPGVGQLFIIEIMADSAAAIAPAGLTSDDVGEWVELESRVDTMLDLYGCALADTGNVETIGAHVLVPPRGLVTLARSMPGFVADYAYGAVKFSDAGDVARIVCGSTVVDMVDFRRGFTLIQGYSLSRDSSGVWCAPTHVYNATAKGVDHGTPGAVNDPCQ